MYPIFRTSHSRFTIPPKNLVYFPYSASVVSVTKQVKVAISWNSDMATAGVSNTYTINPNTYVRSVIALSGRTYTWDESYDMGNAETPIDYYSKTDHN